MTILLGGDGVRLRARIREAVFGNTLSGGLTLWRLLGVLAGRYDDSGGAAAKG